MAILYMDDGIPVNSARFTDRETCIGLNLFELVVEHFPSCMLLVDLLKLQAQNCAKGNELFTKQMLTNTKMSRWIVLARNS